MVSYMRGSMSAAARTARTSAPLPLPMHVRESLNSFFLCWFVAWNCLLRIVFRAVSPLRLPTTPPPLTYSLLVSLRLRMHARRFSCTAVWCGGKGGWVAGKRLRCYTRLRGNTPEHGHAWPPGPHQRCCLMLDANRFGLCITLPHH